MSKKITEKWVKDKCVLVLKKIGAYYFFPVASGYMQSGVPDIVACYKGKFIGIECKANKNTPTKLQIKNLNLIEEAKGKAYIINEHNVDILEMMLTGKQTINEK
jgi:Holliday junction resolvase